MIRLHMIGHCCHAINNQITNLLLMQCITLLVLYCPYLAFTSMFLIFFFSRSTIIENQQGRVAELELSAQSLRESLRDKEKEIEGVVKDLRKQQADGHR